MNAICAYAHAICMKSNPRCPVNNQIFAGGFWFSAVFRLEQMGVPLCSLQDASLALRVLCLLNWTATYYAVWPYTVSFIYQI